ncbi:MAG: M23 family metallopeptidase [Caulobacterales bacterium]
MITRSDVSARVSSVRAEAKRFRRSSVRALAVSLIALGALAGCEQVKDVAHKAKAEIQKVLPKRADDNSNPNPAPAPAPDQQPEGPIVLTPGETPPAETPPATNPDGTPAEPAPPGTEPATPGEGTTPPVTEPAPTTPPVTEPTTPTTPATPEPTTPPETGPTPPVQSSIFKDAGKFIYKAVGMLQAGSGTGSKDETVYAPGIVFPIKDAPTFLNSQVYGTGGMNGAAGSECSTVNYSYPWQDNFCEKRPGASRASYNCPSKAIHQGQDIRAGDAAFCTAIKKVPAATRKGVKVVAVEDGDIQYIGAYTVDLRAGGRIYRYLHLNMKALEVKKAQSVKKGQLIGYLSNDFGVDSAGKPVATTLHLHFEIKQNIDGVGWTWVSPYMSLLKAYEAEHPEAALVK